jgi:hypothetical protein
MSWFDWSPSSDSESSTGNPHKTIGGSFWIYWVISLPLTAIVLIVWRIWWKREQGASDRDLERAMIELELLRTGQDIESPSFISRR